MFKDILGMYISMSDYSKGQIYKVCDVGMNMCYIGSTVDKLYNRMAKHRNHYKKYLEGKHNYIHLFRLFDEYGVYNCKIYWIEDYPCNSKKELEAREGHHILITDCVNKRIEGRSKKQWEEDNRERLKQQKKEYNNERREEKKTYDKIRYENQKEELLKKQSEYGKIKMECECGSIFRRADRSKHLKTLKHQQFINQNNPQEPENDQY